jgi:disulfide bond formation protein DsbB
MDSRFKKWFFLIFLLSVFLPQRVAFADIGPKPTMEFEFTQTGGLMIASGILYECDQPDCSDAEPIKELGPQRLRCDAVSCSALAYGFARYHRLEIQFSDGQTRASNVFETAGFNSRYKVTVRESDLLVEAKFTLNPLLGFALVCACIFVSGILLVVLIVFLVRRSKKK